VARYGSLEQKDGQRKQRNQRKRRFGQVDELEDNVIVVLDELFTHIQMNMSPLLVLERVVFIHKHIAEMRAKFEPLVQESFVNDICTQMLESLFSDILIKWKVSGMKKRHLSIQDWGVCNKAKWHRLLFYRRLTGRGTMEVQGKPPLWSVQLDTMGGHRIRKM